MQRPDTYQARARELCQASGVDPDTRLFRDMDDVRGRPAWTDFRQAARNEHNAAEQQKLAADLAEMRGGITYPAPQPPKYADAPLAIFGQHGDSTIEQMRNCMKVGNVVAGSISADGHLGYAQPVGAAIAYAGQISISGVGYDIACGNMAVKLGGLAMTGPALVEHLQNCTHEIARVLSFGPGRTNDERVEHELFDYDELWKLSGREDYKPTARAQLGTIGGGNHYVDLFIDEEGMPWIGVHFGSRGFGHSSAKLYIEAAGGKDGINVAPVVVDETSEIGTRYLGAMELGGDYAYAGREWVVERVRKIVGGDVITTVHNHHNFAWREVIGGRSTWVVRKGCTPAYPGQRGFIGGSMGDDAVIVEGADFIDTDKFIAGEASDNHVWGEVAQQRLLYSTVHGAGRNFGRKEAKRRYTRAQMEAWMRERGTLLIGGDVDESPMAYRRLPEVLADHGDTIKILHTLRPVSVVMAGSDVIDPYKD